MNEKNILVTGGSGMIGYALKWGHVYGNGIPSANFISSSDYDLRNSEQTKAMFNKYNPDFVIHLAAKVGGVNANMKYVADFYRDNILINTNVLEHARVFKVKKLISLLSTCIYPDIVGYPLTEDQIHNGPPHFSNYGYAYAKRMLDIQTRAYREQYGCNFITVVLNNLFGENDNFDLENSHVIPAMVRKIHEANIKNDDVSLWGDGSPMREFTYSGDMAEILLFLLENYDDVMPINIGNTSECSIKEVADMIADILDYRGDIIWDTSKPSGQYRKPSDNSRLLNIGWDPKKYTDFRKALRLTCNWFLKNYPNVRGIA